MEYPERLIGEEIVVDVETTSFDEEKEGLNPFQGARTCGYAFGPLRGEDEYYLPLRHREGNVDLDSALKFLRDLIAKAKSITNHNIKFDVRFWRHDGIVDTCELRDTMVLARLVHNDMFSYSLESLCEAFQVDKKLDIVKNYVKEQKSKDYGIVPVDLMSVYAKQDVKSTRELYHKLLTMLPPTAGEVWETEKKFTRVLVGSEMLGIAVDWMALKKEHIRHVQELINIQEKLCEIAGPDFNPGSNPDITDLLVGHRGLKPVAYTPTGAPKWDADTLACYDDECAKMLTQYSHLQHMLGTYFEGWEVRKGNDGRLHADYNQSVRTGRLSCRNPNLQNVPPEIMPFILVDPGYKVVKFDYSQMEYRVFAHYTNSKTLLEKYAENPKLDYHSILASLLGIDRKTAKTLNFAFLYGMGKKRLLAKIGEILRGEISEETKTAMLRFIPKQKEITETVLPMLAEAIFNEFHRQVPDVRLLSRRVSARVESAKQLRNYYGRIYQFPDPRFSYKGLNTLIQGSCADLFKDRVVAVCYDRPELALQLNVHDSVFIRVAEDDEQSARAIGDKLVSLPRPLRVPLLVDGEYCRGNLGQHEPITSDAA